MIKLTINPHTQPISYMFEKDLVIIGRAGCLNVDVQIPLEQVEADHIRIMRQSNRFLAVNQANDPFATLNNLPFGKKTLSTSDILKVGDYEILFEEVSSAPPKMADTVTQIPVLLDKMILERGVEASQFPLLSNDFEKDALDLEAEMKNLNAWFKETATASTEFIQSPTQHEETFSSETFPHTLSTGEKLLEEHFKHASEKQTLSPPPPQKQTIKDLYFSDASDDEFERDSKKTADENAQYTSGSRIDWHTIWIILVGILSTLIIGSLLLYANASGKSEDAEVKAAEAAADVAMALTYAQVNSIIPQNQNWSDSEFIKNNLTSVSSRRFPQLAELDSHAQLINTPYLLRIYTSSDLSHFLVIAQPEANLLHWLIPSSTILLYSDDMILRKTDDLKSLNRILVNPSLDGLVANEVATFVQKSAPLVLSASKRQHRLGFSPPKALSLIRPGAETRIYNAPRYYNLGETIMKRAVTLSENQENNREIVLLKNEINILNRYPDFVMYSSEGMQSAMEAQKALSIFDPNKKFLMAYFQYNSEGDVQNGKLLMDDGNGDLALRETPSKWISSSNSPSKSNDPEISDENLTDPLYFQLAALTASRQQVLKSVSNEISILFELENLSPRIDFKSQLIELFDKYQLIDNEQQIRIAKKLAALHREYASMPLSDFIEHLKSAGLYEFAKEKLKTLSSTQLSEEAISGQLSKIQNSRHFEDLEKEVTDAGTMFSLANCPDPEKIVRLQNAVKVATLEKINGFLLSPDHALPNHFFNELNRQRLLRIFKAAWIRDQYEIDYYLNEFDILSKQQPIADKKKVFWEPGHVWEKPNNDSL